MGLAYNLAIENMVNVQDLGNALILSPNAASMFDIGGVGRFRSADGLCQQIYPTGEYIIRDGIFANGLFIYVGSYKAYIRDLFGAGSHGYAWDGFVMVMRGYSVNQPTGFNILESSGIPVPQNFGFLPMRMPIEVNPGADATAIADDTSVGLHGIDIYKSEDDVAVVQTDPNIRIVTCGFQRIDATVEGVPTDSDYVGNLYLADLLTYDSNAATTPTGSQYASYTFNVDNWMQVTWKANVAGHADNTDLTGRFGNLRDLDQAIAGDALMTGFPYDFADMWQQGQLADGSNPGGGVTDPQDKRAISFNYFPRRFLDITCSSDAPFGGEHVGSVFFIVGDMAMDTNDDGSIDDTGPLLMGGAFPYPNAWDAMIASSSPYDYLPPFLIAHPAVTTSLAVNTDTSWWREGAVPTYTFSGAVAALVSLPFEVVRGSLTFIGVNDVTHAGTDYGEIYTTQDSPIAPVCVMIPYATFDGAFTAETGIDLPNKWYNKAVQQRTFSIPEEDLSKYGTLDTTTGVFSPTADSVYDDDAKEYVGYVSNYQRYGLTTDPAQTGAGVTQGTISRNGYGFLGLETGVGPVAIMFDSGAGTMDDTVAPAELTGIILAEGANLNANHIISPTSTTRKIVNAGWDNDRDQWIFISSDTGGVGVISVAADFTTASNNLGFLDQTSNFADFSALPLPITADAGLYIPYSMSDALDGIICFGVWDDDANARFGIKPILGASSAATDTCGGDTVTYADYLQATTSYFYRITGTTGRTAKVWVDYINFDGADALIASKLRERGIKVSIESVEWFKRKIIQSGDLNIKQEEIEEWVQAQQDQFKQMMKDAERQGRVRRRKSQISGFEHDMEEIINPDFMDDEVKDFLGEFTPETRPPTPEEERLEKKRKGGYSPESKSYYDEVFED